MPGGASGRADEKRHFRDGYPGPENGRADDRRGRDGREAVGRRRNLSAHGFSFPEAASEHASGAGGTAVAASGALGAAVGPIYGAQQTERRKSGEGEHGDRKEKDPAAEEIRNSVAGAAGWKRKDEDKWNRSEKRWTAVFFPPEGSRTAADGFRSPSARMISERWELISGRSAS